ncbi:MAG: twin-arginine translocase TatA/TatE family subunit [Steroidobacteraceae bacterium]
MLDLLLIAIIVLLIFGAKKLPTIGSGLGSAIKSLRRSKTGAASAKRAERVESMRPDAEFPEVTDPDRSRRKGG